MKDTSEQQRTPTGTPRLVRDRVMAPMLDVSLGFLQKDRRGARIIPFIQLGDRCLYDVDEVFAAVKARTVGGTRSRRQRPASEAE
jgi:hypothetical protein